MNFTKRIIVYMGIVCAIVMVFFAERQPIVHYAGNILTLVKEYSDAHDDILQDLRQEIFSRPLTSVFSGKASSLSATEIIDLTNLERRLNTVGPLQENKLLDEAARLKLQDMFDRQYFEHISPDGKGPGSLAEKVGYSYVV